MQLAEYTLTWNSSILSCALAQFYNPFPGPHIPECGEVLADRIYYLTSSMSGGITGSFLLTTITFRIIMSPPQEEGSSIQTALDLFDTMLGAPYEYDGEFLYYRSPFYRDIAITSTEPTKAIVQSGSLLIVECAVANLGEIEATFNLTLYAEDAPVSNVTVTLSANSTRLLNLVWNTTGFPLGSYLVRTYVWPIPKENVTSNNAYIGGTVRIAIIDINSDGKINVLDLIFICNRLGWSGLPGSVPEDVNVDGSVNVLDLIATATNLDR